MADLHFRMNPGVNFQWAFTLSHGAPQTVIPHTITQDVEEWQTNLDESEPAMAVA